MVQPPALLTSAMQTLPPSPSSSPSSPLRYMNPHLALGAPIAFRSWVPSPWEEPAPARLPAAVPKQLLLQPWMEEAKHCLFAAWISPSASLVGSGRCVSVQPLCGHRPYVPVVVVMEGPPRPPAHG